MPKTRDATPASPTHAADLAHLIQAVETADSKAAVVESVWHLAAACNPDAIPTLIQVLGYNNPGAAVAAVEGLVKLGKAAVPALLEQLDGYNYGARAWAIRALALIRDPRAMEILLDTASGDFALSVRRAAARGLGTLDWQLLPPEQIAAAQSRACQTLMAVTDDPEWVVRYAAVVGLEALVLTQASLQEGVLKHLIQLANTDPTPAVQARSQMAIEAIRAQS